MVVRAGVLTSHTARSTGSTAMPFGIGAMTPRGVVRARRSVSADTVQPREPRRDCCTPLMPPGPGSSLEPDSEARKGRSIASPDGEQLFAVMGVTVVVGII